MKSMELFYKKVKTQMITDVISMMCLILCMMSVAISIILIIAKLYHFIFLCLIAFTIFLGLIYFIQKRYNSKVENRWKFDLVTNSNYDDMKKKLEDVSDKYYSNGNDCCVYLIKEKNMEYRILLYTTNEFNKKKYYNARKSVNKGFNKKYNFSSTDSVSTVSKRNCINIAFVNGNTQILDNFLNVLADDYVNHASSLLNVAVADNQLFIPYYVGYHFASSSMYYRLCKKVFSLFDLKRESN